MSVQMEVITLRGLTLNGKPIGAKKKVRVDEDIGKMWIALKLATPVETAGEPSANLQKVVEK